MKNQEKPDIVKEIEKLWGEGFELNLPDKFDPTKPLQLLMGTKTNNPRYAPDEDGRLIGLNLAYSGMTDEKWKAILALPGFHPKEFKALNLSGNGMSQFLKPEEFKFLESLDLSENGISDLKFVGQLADLTYFNFSGNPIDNPAPEIVAQGWQAVRRHFERLIEAEKADSVDYLYEAKVLIVGRTGAGKTSLRYKLRGIDVKMPKHDESTRGIDVEPIEFEIEGGRTFRMNVWDFEGQQISYQTHQFFLTKRSLYVFVADQRTEKSDFEYWFQIVELLGDKSPLLIFQNERRPEGEKSGQICAVNLEGLRNRFGDMLCENEYQVNLDLLAESEHRDPEHVEAFKSFQSELANLLFSLPHVGEQLPRTWVNIRSKLEEMAAERDHMPIHEFWELCIKNGIKEKQEQEDLDRLFHDLGIFLHFQSAGEPSLLSRMIILNNLWATKAVYQVLKSDWLRDKKRGHFTLEDLKKVWSGSDHASHADELLELMSKKHFEICYRVAESLVYIAPQLLPPSPPPGYKFPEEGKVLQLRYSYDFMPKGLITRLTVRMHPYIARNQTLAWKDGFVVDLNNGTIAEVTETYGKREIRIRATGEHRRKLLNQVAYEMDRLNDSYNFPEQSPANKLLPCCCVNCLGSPEPHFFVYQQVVNWKEDGWAQVPCGKKGSKPASVDGLLTILLEGDENELHDKRRVHASLDALQKGQDAHRNENKEGFKKLEEYFKDQAKILKDLDDGRISEQAQTEAVNTLEPLLNALLSQMTKEQVDKIKQINDAPDLKSKLKLAIPLIPGVLSYETEFAWDWMKVKSKLNGLIL